MDSITNHVWSVCTAAIDKISFEGNGWRSWIPQYLKGS